MNKQPQPWRGEIWMMNFSPGRGSEQTGTRPALIIEDDRLNAVPRNTNTIVLAITTQYKPIKGYIEVLATPENGIRETSWVKTEQILTVDKVRLERRLGEVTAAQMEAVENALMSILGLNQKYMRRADL